MDAAALRALQAPLKQRYREEPATARTPLHAHGSWPDLGVTCTVDTWAGPVRAGLHPATGGDGADACSGDMLLEALAACAGVTLRSVAIASAVELRDVQVDVDGWFDVRGTLGVDRDTPVGAREVEVRFTVTTEADDRTLDRLATATERYCVVGRSLAEPPRVLVRRRGSA